MLQNVRCPDIRLLSSGAGVGFVRGGHRETRTHAASRPGTLGLLYVALIYPLYSDLAHSSWLQEMKNECEPMFLSWFIALGPFLLLAARKPSLHRSLIAFTAWQCLAHASVMTIQTVQAYKHGVHRDFTDVLVFGAIGAILLALSLERRKQSAVVTP